MEQEFIDKKRQLEIRYEAAVKHIKDKFQGLIAKSLTIEKKIE